MSNHQRADDDDIPRFEPWLGVTASSLIPAVIALYASRVLIPSIVATVALFLTGMLMLRRQTVRRRLEQQNRPVPGVRSVAPAVDIAG